MIQRASIANGQAVLTYPGDLVDIGVWSIIETNVSVICICFITIKPVLQRLFPSSAIFKVRQRWSRLCSSHFYLSSNPDSTTRTQHKGTTRTYNSFARLHETASQLPAGTNGRSKPKVRMSGEKHGIPMQAVKIRNAPESFGDNIV